jgi:hypothetical protein
MRHVAWDRTILTVGAMIVGALALQELWVELVAGVVAYVAAAVLLTDPRIERHPHQDGLQGRRARM